MTEPLLVQYCLIAFIGQLLRGGFTGTRGFILGGIFGFNT